MSNGFKENLKEAAEATTQKISRAVEDFKDRASDKADEVEADAKLRKAEADKESVEKKNEYKESLRGDRSS